DELDRVGNGLEQSEGADAVGATANLEGADDAPLQPHVRDGAETDDGQDDGGADHGNEAVDQHVLGAAPHTVVELPEGVEVVPCGNEAHHARPPVADSGVPPTPVPPYRVQSAK